MRGLLKAVNRIDFGGEPRRNAWWTAFAVFAGLYLAVGIGLLEFLPWHTSLLWPFHRWPVINRTTVITLTSYAAVALYAYRLKLYLMHIEGHAAQERYGHEAVLRQCEDRLQQAIAEQKKALERTAAAENNARLAAERERQAQARAAAAEARAREDAPQESAEESAAPGKDNRFTLAKKAFARLYHPDRIKAEGLDKMIRAEIFKEYWRELEAIEKHAKKR